MTSLTSAIGVDVASDKSLTNRLLDSAGLPVPRADVVDTEDGAVAAARRLGFPCVVKPLDGNHGRGVHLDLRSEEAVRAAFHGALAQSRGGDVVIETYVAGNDYRCLVIGGKVAAIAERVPASVTGDGEHTVRELVDIANSDPRRGIGHEKVLTRIKVDEAAEALVRAMTAVRPEIVINQLTDLPANLEPSGMTEGIARTTRIRIEGTRNLVAAALEAGARRVIAKAWLVGSTRMGLNPILKTLRWDLRAEAPSAIVVQGVAALEQLTTMSPPLEGVVLRYGQIYGTGNRLR